MNAVLRKLEIDGFVNLGVLNPELSTLAVAKNIGTVAKISGLADVQRLSPKSKSAQPKNTYSGNYGKDEFPLHTDLAHWHLPPRYFLLRCVKPDSQVETLILHFEKALKGLPHATRSRALFKPRRKLENKMFFLRFIQDEIFRWDQLYLTPENIEAKEVSSFIQSLDENKFSKFCFKEKSQTILVDNWKVLHGRSKIENSTCSRLIERVYISELHS